MNAVTLVKMLCNALPLLCMSMSPTGMPTMLERPTTTQFFPEISTPERFNNSIQPAGVQDNADGLQFTQKKFKKDRNLIFKILLNENEKLLAAFKSELTNVLSQETIDILFKLDMIQHLMLPYIFFYKTKFLQYQRVFVF